MKTLQKSNTKISEMFNGIAPRYDLLNHLLSANLDKIWRKNTIKQIDRTDEIRILDVATGTGDLALEAVRLKPVEIVGIDISEKMLEIAKKKVSDRKISVPFSFQIAAAEDLPFEDEEFDFVTVAFGVRNFEDLQKGFSEMRRVLKQNGKLIILEFSKPDNSILKSIYYFYFKNILPLIGKIVSKSSFAYTYLPDSVDDFPYGKELLKKLNEAGFTGTLDLSSRHSA
jgi:demethylmenaquinone methyltransferase/2-methoxy-6-polyprenyl-1,4-benzoquinol methylase